MEIFSVCVQGALKCRLTADPRQRDVAAQLNQALRLWWAVDLCLIDCHVYFISVHILVKTVADDIDGEISIDLRTREWQHATREQQRLLLGTLTQPTYFLDRLPFSFNQCTEMSVRIARLLEFSFLESRHNPFSAPVLLCFFKPR